MRTSQKIMVAVSIAIFSSFLLLLITRNYVTLPYSSILEQVSFGIVFLLAYGALFGCLQEFKVSAKVYFASFFIMSFVVFSVAFILIKTTDIEYWHVKSQYSDINDRIIKANPDVVNLDAYKVFKEHMDGFMPAYILQERKNEPDLTSIDTFKLKLINDVVIKSDNDALKAHYMKIMNDNFFSINEYQQFMKDVDSLPESEIKYMLQTIDKKIR